MKEYEFFVGTFFYKGEIIDENETHWKISDRKLGIIEIPKTAVRREVTE